MVKGVAERRACHNGVEACRILKQTHPHVKVVLHSAHSQDVERAAQAQVADAYLAKGDVYDELVPCLQQLMTAPACSPRRSTTEEC